MSIYTNEREAYRRYVNMVVAAHDIDREVDTAMAHLRENARQERESAGPPLFFVDEARVRNPVTGLTDTRRESRRHWG